MILEPEFARVLTASRRDNNTLSTVLREAWEGNTLSVSTRTRPLRALSPHIALIGHATAAELRTKLSDNDLAGGLVNRFLIVGVRRSKLLPSGERPPDDLLKALGQELRERLQIGRSGPHQLRRTVDAEMMWQRLYTDVLNSDDDDETAFGQAVTRGPAYVARLSLVYAVLDGASAIEVPHVQAAALAWDYCYSSARQIFDTRETRHSEDFTRAEAYIRGAEGRGVTRSEMTRLFRNKTQADLDRLTSELLAGGDIVYGEKPSRSKHASLVWAADFQIAQRKERSASP
jgi:putative DNA primase/helicase